MQLRLTNPGRVPALLAASLFAHLGWAQVGAPLLGYLPAGGNILPVHGISASASTAPALDFGRQFQVMAISPRHDFALASDASSGAVLIAYPGQTTTAVAGTAAFPSSITLSPTGSAAALWFDRAQTLQIVSGLPSAPVIREVNAAFLNGASGDGPAALAVSDDGAWAAGAWASGVWAFGPNGEVRNVFSSDRVFALAFLTGQQNLAAAAPSGVYSITGVGGAASISTIFASPGLVPTGLAASADNTSLILSDRRGAVFAISSSTGSASRIECGCQPEGVFPMGGPVFRITGLTGSVFRVFDAVAGSIFQIPLAAAGPPAGEPVKTGRGLETITGASR